MNANEAISKIRFMLDVGGSDGFTSADKEALNMVINALTAEISKKPKSNADRIRQMTDEELAEWLNGICNRCISDSGCTGCPIYDGCAADVDWQEKWLKQEVSEDAGTD